VQQEWGHRSRARVQAIGILLAVPLCLTLAVQPAFATPGAQLWARRYSGPAKLYDEANALAVSPDGTKVFSTGFSRSSPSSNDYATVAYDAATGAKLWVQRFDGPAHLDDQAEAIAVSPDGSTVFVTGTSDGDYATVAYAASNGAVVWTKRYDGRANSGSEARALVVSPDGSTVFVTGHNYGTTSSIDYATVAYDASNGTKVWARRYNGPLNSHDEANALSVSPDGSSVFVTGYSYGLTQRADYATVGYDASTGARMWVSRYAEPSNENEEPLGATAVVVSPDGSSVFVTGRNRSLTTANDYATVAYDTSTGEQLWARRYDGPGASQEQANAIGVSPDGSSVFVTGSSSGSSGRSDYATVAYEASTGTTQWVKRYNGPADAYDFAYALGVSPDGSSVFVTGSSRGTSTGDDFTTVALDASIGTKIWVAYYDGPLHSSDVAGALGVSPDGSKLFVTGDSYGATSTQDYATVAYATT
jgi:sugar lactone lactonase YvrE